MQNKIQLTTYSKFGTVSRLNCGYCTKFIFMNFLLTKKGKKNIIIYNKSIKIPFWRMK